MRRKQAIEEVGRVQSDHRVAAFAVERFRRQAELDPTILDAPEIELSEVRRCGTELDATYLVRLFAVFEMHLRDIWEKALGRGTHPVMRDLMDGCAARQAVPYDILTNAHLVREYRNSVVHGGDAPRVLVGDARQYLCVFLGRMPPEW